MLNATALICDDQQQFTLEDVTLAGPADDQVAIRTHHTGVSIGTEFALIQNRVSWGPYPLCTGYQGTGIVEAVGSAIDRFQVGDPVYFRANDAMQRADGSDVSCVSGTHCSHVVTRPDTTHGVDPLVPGVSMETAALYVMPAVGLYGVDQANPRMGQTVVVYGVGLIGLGVVAACIHRGCFVIAVDVHDQRLEMARRFGADVGVNATAQDVEEAVRVLAPDGADVVFECTGNPKCMAPALELLRLHGSFVCQGHYGNGPFPMHFNTPHARQVRIFFPCDDGFQPCRRAVVRNMASGALPREQCITHRIPMTEAPAMFQRINEGKTEGILGVVIDWRD